MLPELEKPKVTEIQVRMDCNGCVQKIKKALHGINGIYDIYIDIPQQKLTIIGWADPEKIVKAIKKTRKTATICSHTIPSESQPPLEEAPPSSDTTNAPGEEAPPPPPEQNPQAEPLVASENPPPDVATPSQPTKSTANQPPQYSRPKEVEEVHVVYRYPPDQAKDVHVYNGRADHYPGSQGGLGFRHEPLQPIHVSHSYNTYKPTPYITAYEYNRPPIQYTPYNRQEQPGYASYSWSEQPQQYIHYKQEPPYNRSEQPQPSYIQPEPQPQNYVRVEPSPPHYSRLEPIPPHYCRSESPPQQNCQPEPPQHYNKLEPPHRNHQPEPPQQKRQPETPQQNRQREPSHQQTYYNRPTPPRQYTRYYQPEPPHQYTLHSRPEPLPPHAYYDRLESPHYMHYNGKYYQSSDINDDITSPFGDEDPNGCKIV